MAISYDDDVPLLPEQRREKIVQLLRSESILSYRKLAASLNVSHMTVRRDVSILESEGRAVSTSGGTKLAGRLNAEPPRSTKRAVDIRQKQLMSRKCAALVKDSMTIYLDAGTTLQPIHSYLEQVRDLTVITNDLIIASSFSDHPRIEVIAVGGRLEKQNQSTVGRLPALVLAQLSVDIAFLTSSSWDIKHGVSIPAESKVEPKRAAMGAATQSILVAASSKYGSFARYKVAPLSEFDLIITDTGLTTDTVRSIEHSAHVHVDTAEMK